MGYFVKKDKHGVNGFVLPSGPTAERPSVPIDAHMRYNTDTNSIEYFNGTIFVDMAKSGTASTVVDKITTVASVSTYTMSIEETDDHNVIVFVDGIYQTPGATKNYIVSNFDIVFSSAPPSGLEIIIIHGAFGTFVAGGDEFVDPGQ